MFLLTWSKNSSGWGGGRKTCTKANESMDVEEFQKL